MFDNFGMEINNLLKEAEKERSRLHHPYVGSEHLFLAMLNHHNIINLFSKYNLNYDLFKKELITLVGIPKKDFEYNLYTPLLKRIITNALEIAKRENKGMMTINHLLISLIEEGEGVAIRILTYLKIDLDEIYTFLKKDSFKENDDKLMWGKVLNDEVSLKEVVVNREKEITFIIETLLRKKKNNPLLIGEAGVGKTAIVEELARRIKMGKVPSPLINKKIISLEMSSLVAGTKYRGEFEEKITNIIKEVEKRDDLILFIDEIHSMVSAGGAEGAISAGDILKPYLARSSLKCIGSTTIKEYEKYIVPDKALARRFEIININEPNEKETIAILNKIKKEYENHHQIIISTNIIKLIVSLSMMYFPDKRNPDKAIDLMDTACSIAKLNNKECLLNKKYQEELYALHLNKDEAINNNDFVKANHILEKELLLKETINHHEPLYLRKKDVLKVIINKTNMPTYKNVEKEAKDLNKYLKKEISNYDNLIDEITKLILFKFHNLNEKINIYLGGNDLENKTKLIKLISNYLNNYHFINIDLKDYQSDSSLSKLIGMPMDYLLDNNDYLFKQIKYYPFSLILFDNIEYASFNILNYLKQINEKGFIKDSKGDNIYFNRCLIFYTSNKDSKIIGFNPLNKVNNLDNEDYLKGSYIFNLNEKISDIIT